MIYRVVDKELYSTTYKVSLLKPLVKVKPLG